MVYNDGSSLLVSNSSDGESSSFITDRSRVRSPLGLPLFLVLSPDDPEKPRLEPHSWDSVEGRTSAIAEDFSS